MIIGSTIGLVDLVILFFAVYRLSSLLVDEPGFLNVFVHVRKLARVDPAKLPEDQPNPLAGILSCVYCCSVWIGAAVAIGWYVEPLLTLWLSLPFALSAGAIWIYNNA